MDKIHKVVYKQGPQGNPWGWSMELNLWLVNVHRRGIEEGQCSVYLFQIQQNLLTISLKTMHKSG